MKAQGYLPLQLGREDKYHQRSKDYLTCLKVIRTVVNMNSMQSHLIFEWPFKKQMPKEVLSCRQTCPGCLVSS